MTGIDESATERRRRGAAPPRRTRPLSRGVSATWWYTATAVFTFDLVLVGVWAIVISTFDSRAPVALVVVGGLVWCASLVPLLFDYRQRLDVDRHAQRTRLFLPVALALGYGVAAGLVVGSWTLVIVPIVQSLMLLSWRRGVRAALVIGATVALSILAAVDVGPEGDFTLLIPLVYSVMLPVMTVSSLWWWDVLIALDRARASEARLAAAQERLRVANDVHDLQGHHLQVIALQLELAERLMPHDAEAGMEQLAAARGSVDDARQGTRDLALSFRSVPLGDEIANARDLLEAAGLDVDAVIPPDADDAPAAVLGPVVRETTTNVLRHGGGRRARLVLSGDGEVWQYEISNDVSVIGGRAGGSGLDGIRQRVGEVHGSLEVVIEENEFTVFVIVPALKGEKR